MHRGPAAESATPGGASNLDPDRAPDDVGASPPAPEQRRGERPVISGQARHFPGGPLDLPLQGFDLPAVLPLFHLVVRGQPFPRAPSTAVRTRSYSLLTLSTSVSVWRLSRSGPHQW